MLIHIMTVAVLEETVSEKVYELVERADGLCDKRRYEEAIELYDLASSIEPHEVIYNNKGVALDLLDEHEKAIMAYERALELNRDYATAWHNKGNSHRYIGQFKDALECYDRAISIESDNDKFYFDKAEVLMELGLKRKAKKVAADGVEQGTSDPASLYVKKGNVLANNGDFEGALMSYEKALDHDGEDMEIWKLRADTFLNMGQFKDAYDAYKDILKVYVDPEVLNNLGYILFSTDRYEKAEQYYKRSIELGNDFGPAHYNLAYLYHTKGNYEDAIIHYKEAAKTDGKNEVLWNNLGNALYNMGRYRDSLPYFKKAIEVDPAYHIAWNNIGNVFNKLGEHERSITYHEKAIKLSPDMDYYHYALGHAMAKGGKMEEGLEEVNISLDLNPNFETALFVKADILKMLGRDDESLDTLDHIIKLNPKNGEAWEMRGAILEAHEKFEEARFSFNEALKSYEKNFKTYNDVRSLLSKGALLQDLGKNDEALETYERVLKVSDKEATHWIKLIELQLELEMYREAVVTVSKALDFFDEHKLYILKGKAYEGIGNHEKAEQSLTKAVKMNGVDARMVFARYLADRGYHNRAYNILQDENWEERLLRANILLESGKPEDAEALYRELIDERAGSLRAWFGLGRAHIYMGNIKKAMKALDTCIGISHNFEPAWYQKAYLFYQKGEVDKARFYANTALNMAEGSYLEAEELLNKLDKGYVEEPKSKDFEKMNATTRNRLLKVRRSNMDISEIKMLMREATEAGKRGHYDKGIVILENVNSKLGVVENILELVSELQVLILRMKEEDLPIQKYLEDTKEIKTMIDKGDHENAEAFLKADIDEIKTKLP